MTVSHFPSYCEIYSHEEYSTHIFRMSLNWAFFSWLEWNYYWFCGEIHFTEMYALLITRHQGSMLSTRLTTVAMDLDDMMEVMSTMFLHYKLFLPFHTLLLGVVVVVLVTQSCLTLCNPMDCSPPDSFIHGISEARILEWVAVSSSRGSFGPKDRTWVSDRFFTFWASWEEVIICRPHLRREELYWSTG